MSAAFSGWLVEALIASSLLMIFVLAARKEAQRALGPQLAYWLWALPALRMAMPPLPASWRESAAAPITAASETVLVLVEPIVHPVAQAAAGDPFPWLWTMVGAWGLGALAFFIWHGIAHLQYVGRILAPPARHERLPDGTTLVESDEAVGPVAFGVLKRFVAVPADFAERYDADERELALAHELGHHARGDLIANWIALAMLAVHWFNPLAWLAYRKFRGDQEMANDARVLGSLPPIERHAYACAIVKAAHGRAVTAACHLHTIEDLKGRLRMLKASRKSRRVLLAGAAGIAGLTVAGLGLTASGAAAEKLRTVASTQMVAMTQSDDGAADQAAAAKEQAAAAREQAVAAREQAASDADRGASMVEHSVRENDDGGKRTRSVRLVIKGQDGVTRTYNDAEADAYLAAHPELQPPAPGQQAREVRRSRIVIRDKDGKTRTYDGADADAYLRAHPDMRPPAPPVPPGPVGAVPALPAPPAPSVYVTTNGDGRQVKTIVRTGPGGYAFASGQGVDVSSGDCHGGDQREFVRRETKDGKPRMIICEKRIERYAADQARMAERMGRLSASQTRMAASTERYSKLSALSGLNAGRMAILNARDLTDEQRDQALAGIDQAREQLQRQMRDDKDDK